MPNQNIFAVTSSSKSLKSSSTNSYYCTYCNKEISKSNKAKHERTKIHNRNFYKGSDIQQSSSTIAKFIPGFLKTKYGELHLPGHNFTGPLTRLDLRLDSNDKPLPDSIPINRVDQAAYKHDLAYRADDIRTRQKADIDLIQDLNEIPNPTFREKFDKAIVKTAMKAKIVLGGEVDNKAPLVNEQPSTNKQLADELHKEYRRPSKYLKVKVFNKDDIWAADLIETVNSKNNNGYKYILTIIDLYTRYAWAVPLKNKTGNSVTLAFEDLFENTPDRIPRKLWVDKGSEFYNC